MKISTQIRFLASGLVLLTALLIGLVIYWGYLSLVDNQNRESLENRVAIESKRFESSFAELQHDVGLLVALPVLQRLADTLSSSVEARASNIEFKNELADIFAAILQAKPYAVQMRLIGVADQGKEIVRVDHLPEGLVRIPEDQLQSKGSRDYFLETVKLNQGEFYFSPVNLNREFGQIQVPHQAMLRAAMPVYSGGKVVGIVIINLDFQRYFNALFAQSTEEFQYYLTNSQGDYLIHPNKELTFGFELGTRHRVQEEFPEINALFDSDQERIYVRHENPNPRILQFQKVRIFPDAGERFQILGVSADYNAIGETSDAIARNAYGVTFALVLAAVVAAYLLSSRLIHPLSQIATAADRISHGNESGALPLESDNEIGALARAFQQMVKKLSEREQKILVTSQELQTANQDLEHFAKIAAHDLREPARRVVAFSGMLAASESESSSPQSLELVERIESSANRMLEQIDEFRAFARVGQGELKRSEVNLEQLIQSLLEEKQDEIERRRIVVEIQKQPVLLVYKSLVEVLYRNLIGNALQHVSIDAITLSFTAEQVSERWQLGVKNTGSSIQEKYLSTIFAPFQRLNGDQSSMGMGLPVCKRIVDKHSGKIWAESGTDFVWIRYTLAGAS